MKLHRLIAVPIAALIGGCGGGGGGGGKIVLPVDDAAPQAYTSQYLYAHPDALVQPEHLLVIALDPEGPGGGTTTVGLHVANALSLQLGMPAQGTAMMTLSEIIVRDASGVERAHYRDGAGPVQMDLSPGEHTITVVPRIGLSEAHTVFLKLAETPTQASRRLRSRDPSAGGLLGASSPSLSDTHAGESCESCDFSNSILSGANLQYSSLNYSTFRNTEINGVNFHGAFCFQCQFTSDTNNFQPIRNSNFDQAALTDAVFDRVDFSANTFRGAGLSHVVLKGLFDGCDFGQYSDEYTTSPVRANLAYSDLTAAKFLSSNVFTAANLSNTKVSPTTFLIDAQEPTAIKGAFAGAVFDGMSPATVFVDGGRSLAGYDLSGTSFAGIDLSTQDLSTAGGTTISLTTNLAQATLSSGTRGINLSGQAFPVAYTPFAGDPDVPNSGKDLRYTNLSNVSLYEADLTRVQFDGAVLVGADLSYTNLYGATFKGSQLGVAPGSGTQAAARLNNAYMPYVDFSDADLRSTSFAGAHMYGDGVSFQRARLDSASLVGALVMQASFVGASLNDADLSGASLVVAAFDNANLTNAKLFGAYLQGTNFASAATMVGADLTNSAVSTVSGAWQFTELDGLPHTYPYDPTALGQAAISSSVICPSGSYGPCTGAKLLPLQAPLYPPAPACVPLRKFQYRNCEQG